MKITREQLRRWGACYDDERIAELVPEAGLPPLEIAALDIPEEDRLWVLLREDIVPARDLRLLACDWAESACRKSGWGDARSLNAIAVARRFACGDATEADLDAAARSAWAAVSAAAAEAAAAAAAREAAWAAARAAARAAEAAWAAVSAAAAEASSAAAAREAAWAAEAAAAEEQLADVVKVLKG